MNIRTCWGEKQAGSGDGEARHKGARGQSEAPTTPGRGEGLRFTAQQEDPALGCKMALYYNKTVGDAGQCVRGKKLRAVLSSGFHFLCKVEATVLAKTEV